MFDNEFVLTIYKNEMYQKQELIGKLKMRFHFHTTIEEEDLM